LGTLNILNSQQPRRHHSDSAERRRGGGEKVGGGAYGVDLGVGGELEGVADHGAVGGVEAGAAGAPERLQDVLQRLLGSRARQQVEVLVPPQRRRRRWRAALALHHRTGRGSVPPPPRGGTQRWWKRKRGFGSVVVGRKSSP